MSYREKLTALGDETERRVLAVYTAYLAGELSHDETVAYIAAVVAQANSSATALADLSLAAELMLTLRTSVETVGVVRPVGDLARLTKAATTVLAIAQASPVPESIVGRLARSEPLEAAAQAYSEAIRKSPHVKGWVRQKSPGACELCTWWWRNGRVWPAAHPMPTHKGCTCSPKPVAATEIQSTEYTRRLTNA